MKGLSLGALVASALLTGCTAAQVAQTDAVIATVPSTLGATCSVVEKGLAVAGTVAKGGAAATVSNSTIYADSVCLDATALATAAADPTTVTWLNGLLTAGQAAVAAPAT